MDATGTPEPATRRGTLQFWRGWTKTEPGRLRRGAMAVLAGGGWRQDRVAVWGRLPRRVAAIGAAVLLAAMAGIVASAPPALAQASVTLYVNGTMGMGTQSTGCAASGTQACPMIQEAIDVAEGDAGDNVTIEVAPGTYTENDTISAGPASLIVQGAGAASTTIDGNADGSVVMSTGTVTISGFTLTNGTGSTDGAGGVVNDGTLTMTGDTLSGDTGGAGGVLNDDGTLTMTGDTLSGDTGEGGAGGVNNDGTLTMTGDTLSGDEGVEAGGVLNGGGTLTMTGDTLSGDEGVEAGGVTDYGGTLTMTGDTLSDDMTDMPGVDGGAGGVTDNGVTDNGGTLTMTGDTLSNDEGGDAGGVVAYAVTATMTNDTLSDDTGGSAGGVATSGSQAVTLTSDTLSDDTGGSAGGVYGGGSTTSVADSIFYQSGCVGAVTDSGHNVESDASCGFSSPGDMENDSTIDLGALAANGSSGPQTLALLAGSNVLDTVPAADCTVGTDERGEPRPGISGQANCDPGAYELQEAITSPNATTFGFDAAGSFTVTTTGDTPPALTETGQLPPGVSFTDNGNGTATLSGTPTQAGTYPIIVYATVGGGPAAATQSFTLTVTLPTPTVSITNIPASAAYGGSFTPTYRTSGDGTSFSATSTSPDCIVSPAGVVSFVGVGPCTLTASVAATSNYAEGTGTPQTFNIAAAPTTLTAAPVSLIRSVATISVTFSATLTSQVTGGGVGGQPVTFSWNTGNATCTATTTATGVATCTVSVLNVVGLVLCPTYTATFAPPAGSDYLTSTATGTVKLI